MSEDRRAEVRRTVVVLADRWGVTDEETSRRYLGDEVVPSPWLAAWRGVDVRTPPAAVWPWLGQVRLAPYSYDWLDNLGRRSPRRLVGLPEPREGDVVRAFGGRPVGEVLAVRAGTELAIGIGSRVVMSYALVPQDDVTRLLLKVVTRRFPPVVRPAALSLGDLVMARRQLTRLARLAESGRERSDELDHHEGDGGHAQ